MRTRFRAAVLVLALFCIASAASGVDVAATLNRASSTDCLYGPGGEENCARPVLATVTPAAGSGVVHLDAAGQVIYAALALEAFTVGGLSAPAASVVFDRAFRVDQPAAGWPSPGVGAGGFLAASRLADQGDFSATLTLAWIEDFSGGYRQWSVEFSVTPIGGAVSCPGERLFLDDDGDGETNSRDAAPWWTDTQFGDAVDADGRTIAEFCDQAGANFSPRPCARLDFGNDEPVRRPRDCRFVAEAGSSQRVCRPATFTNRSQPPATASRTCLGLGVVDDADADGEPDATDHCPGTPSGSVVDGNGCDAPRFCSMQSVKGCKRADFLNDEPLAKKPRDCARTKTKPLACAVATF